MAKRVWAIYENGVLRLLEPLDLRDGQRVCIQVVEVEPVGGVHALRETQQAYVAVIDKETDEDGPDLVARILGEAGLLVPRPAGSIPPSPVSEKERRAIARRAGHAMGKTASEMVIEDRGER